LEGDDGDDPGRGWWLISEDTRAIGRGEEEERKKAPTDAPRTKIMQSSHLLNLVVMISTTRRQQI
jgi:hypothetical protein